MASLSRKARLKQCCWELLDDLAFCRERYPPSAGRDQREPTQRPSWRRLDVITVGEGLITAAPAVSPWQGSGQAPLRGVLARALQAGPDAGVPRLLCDGNFFSLLSGRR